MIAVIMAGGKGTRLRSISKDDVPKPMVQVLEKPILQYQIESLKASQITDIIIIVGYLGNVIKNYFQDGSRFGVSISYLSEETPLGTAGSLFLLKNKIKEDFLLAFGDLMLDVDWKRFLEFHKKNHALITLFGHPNSHPFDSDLILMDKENRVVGIDSKNNVRNYYYHNFVNAGLYCINPQALEVLKAPVKTDLEKDVISSLILEHKVYAYRSTEYVKDMGTPERYFAVENDLRCNLVSKRSLRNKQKAIFLDRDGTINKYVGFLTDINQFELMPKVAEAIKKINQSEYLAIVVTNQPVIARGEVTFEELEEIHKKMETLLGKEGAYIDDLYFCPHHPYKGFPGEVKELKIDCACRKPKIGMLLEASEKYNIALEDSWLIGDSTIDIKTAENASMHSVLLRCGVGGKDNKYSVLPEMTADDLFDAVSNIVK